MAVGALTCGSGAICEYDALPFVGFFTNASAFLSDTACESPTSDLVGYCTRSCLPFCFLASSSFFCLSSSACGSLGRTFFWFYGWSLRAHRRGAGDLDFVVRAIDVDEQVALDMALSARRSCRRSKSILTFSRRCSSTSSCGS